MARHVRTIVSRCRKMSELRNHLKRPRRSIGAFSNLVDECSRSITKEFRALANVNDSLGMKSHQLRADCIGGHRIIRKHDLSERAGSAVERPVAFHGHDAVRDHEMDRNGCAQIKDALLNAFPMENVLRPSYLAPGTTPNIFFMLRVTPDQ